MAASFFRGTQLDQNVKFKDKDKELTKKWNFPPEFDCPVDIKKVSARAFVLRCLKVQIDVIKLWVERRITELMGGEDEILSNLVIAQLEQDQGTAGHSDRKLDPKIMQV